MHVYAIYYEIRENSENVASRREFLAQRIKMISEAFCCPLDGVWLIRTDRSISNIRDEVLPYLSKEDKLSVLLSGGACAWYGLAAVDSMWLHDHL